MNIANLLAIADQLDPDRTIATDSRENLTVHGLALATHALSQRIMAAAIGPGAVAFVGVNSVAAPTSLFASALASRAFAPVNYRADDGLLTYLLDELSPSVIVADDQYRERIDLAVRGQIPVLSTSRIARETVSEPLSVPPETASAAVLMFTSGTSSRPKIVVLRHTHLTSYVLTTTAPMSEAEGAASLVSAPVYHIAALINVLTSTFSGRRMVFLPTFTASDWLAAAEREKVTHAFVVPTMLHRIVTELRKGATPPSALKTLAYGGASAAPSLIFDALQLMNGTGFVNAYGLTETSSTISVLGPDEHRVAAESNDENVRARIRSVGRPLPGVEVALSSSDETGEILVRGGQVSGDHGGRAPRVDRDGWFHTGDLGRFDADGYLFIVGRVDDMIIRGGENISPLEIEEVLRRHSAVEDVAVVGVSDPEWGHIIAAAMVLRGNVSKVEVIQWARERLPSFKCPTLVEFVQELPRNDMGKLQRFRVKQHFEAALPER